MDSLWISIHQLQIWIFKVKFYEIKKSEFIFYKIENCIYNTITCKIWRISEALKNLELIILAQFSIEARLCRACIINY